MLVKLKSISQGSRVPCKLCTCTRISEYVHTRKS